MGGILGCNVGDNVASLSFYNEVNEMIRNFEKSHYLQHVKQSCFASIIEPEKEEFRVLVEKTK